MVRKPKQQLVGENYREKLQAIREARKEILEKLVPVSESVLYLNVNGKASLMSPFVGVINSFRILSSYAGVLLVVIDSTSVSLTLNVGMNTIKKRLMLDDPCLVTFESTGPVDITMVLQRANHLVQD